MNESQPPVCDPNATDKGISQRILVRGAQALQEERDGERGQAGPPERPQHLRGQLEEGADAEELAQLQVRREGRVGEGAYHPAREVARVPRIIMVNQDLISNSFVPSTSGGRRAMTYRTATIPVPMENETSK